MRSDFAVRAACRSFQPRLELLEARDCPAAPTITLMAMGDGPNTFMVQGHVSDEHPGGLTVVLSGAYKGTVVTNAQGDYQTEIQPASTGTLQATVTDDENLSASASAMLYNMAPSITSFMAQRQLGNVWVFSGHVMDEYPAGLTVRLGGMPSLNGVTVVTDANGDFSVTLQLQDGEGGTATAQTTDWWGLDSNVADWWFFPAS